MQRRDALHAITGLALGAIAGCTDAPHHFASPTTAPPNPSRAAEAPLPGEVRHGPRDRPRVALTFHGQGDPGLVTDLLDELDRGGARVTVLAVGTWLAAQPALGRRILAGGHELGNHTQHHADIKTMKPELAYAEITHCAGVIQGVSGSIGRWFRPSRTPHATPMIQAAARRAGYPTCLSYDVDPRDFTDPGASAIVTATLAAVRPGSIVSLHCGHQGTVSAIGPLLAGLRARALQPVTTSELFA
ncbi:polysaccharide deacetylase [Actinoplanes ianthinogenes]|uniref:Polysaccharide deacetylase n=1 Tax=Actinoplanes ianthinogenes TaxID=122358 RepID=A0ABN6CQX1_9ACTN|nr:polysaccharide deacetylase family protein [Actinoplanes ianthinogenes]BCJ47621.1 polysaccharide deacetylase [Actinoplanes ianthinogenes]GGR02981.1 polysaccharide deacetylase [Actinoplanes ianthinogenes]